MTRTKLAATGAFAILAVLLLAAPASAISGDTADNDTAVAGDYAPYVLGADSLDLEQDRGYTTEYMFGMSKAIRTSTLNPALKPVVWLVTVPLDIAFLPFAAIGGFF